MGLNKNQVRKDDNFQKTICKEIIVFLSLYFTIIVKNDIILK